MHLSPLTVGLAVGLSTGLAAARPASPPRAYVVHPDRVAAVQAAFNRSWDGYLQYAFPHDSLRPIRQTYVDDRNGWGASAVDALSTALVLGHAPAVQAILAHVAALDWDAAATDADVSLFETTIRYLGGLLSGYDLLTGPLAGGPLAAAVSANATAAVLLRQAVRLADRLRVAFDTPSGVPDNALRFGPARRLRTRGTWGTRGTRSTGSTSLAAAGTLVLEWTRLSDLTGDPAYAQLAQRAQRHLLDPQPQPLAEPFPGLVGSTLDLATGSFLDGDGGWGAGTDSFYEYLLKMYVYDPDAFADYKDRWVQAVDSSMRHLASHPLGHPDLTFLAVYSGTTPQFESQHLACFAGGNIVYGGAVLGRPDYVAFGLNLTAACHATYAATASRIGPEAFSWQDDGGLAGDGGDGAASPPPLNQTSFARTAGFWITDAAYVLRPEVLESYYYAYRATGDPRYQDWAWDAFVAINATCAAGRGYSSIADVNAAGGRGGGFRDFQESFWFAEVLKYSFLIQAADAPFQVPPAGAGPFVYNTECHPLRVRHQQ